MARPARSARSAGSSASSGVRTGDAASDAEGPRRSAHAYVGLRVLLNPLWCYWGFMASVIVVTVFGLLMVFSSSTVDVVSNRQSPWMELAGQAGYCAVGLAFGAFAMHVPRNVYHRFGLAIVVVAWIVQSLTMTPLGTTSGGNSGWIRVLGVSFQPAEFLKLALCIWLPVGMGIAQRRMREKGEICWKAYALPGAVSVISFVFVILGHDLGTAMIVALICMFAFLVGGFPLRWLLGVCAVGAAAIVGIFVLGSGNRTQRILATYTECTADQAQGVCFQTIHGNFAMGSGGLFGVGLGNSREKWNYLPAAHNDFIFAIIGEELGFVGAGLLILGFVVMGWCMVGVALQCRDRYARMVIVCIAAWIVGQALINIAVVLGILPVMGLPMPFVSAGGSALVMCLGAAGVTVQMMRQQADVRAALARA